MKLAHPERPRAIKAKSSHLISITLSRSKSLSDLLCLAHVWFHVICIVALSELNNAFNMGKCDMSKNHLNETSNVN